MRNGQEKEDPDPTSAASTEKVSSLMYVCKHRLSLEEVLILVRVLRCLILFYVFYLELSFSPYI